MSAQGEVYEIRVRGHLDHHWATWTGCTDLVHHDDGTTTLRTGPVDQSQLHGILTRLRDTGAALISVEARDDPAVDLQCIPESERAQALRGADNSCSDRLGAVVSRPSNVTVLGTDHDSRLAGKGRTEGKG